MRSVAASARGLRVDVLRAVLAVSVIGALVLMGVPGTGALFTDEYPQVAVISAGQIFPDDRSSAAFEVSDHSSGSGVDASSPYAFAGDGRTGTTSAWPNAFATDRYVEVRLNASLPAGVAVTAASFDLSWASLAGTACLYLEIRDSGGTLVDAQGDAGTPLSCTSSSSPVVLVTPLPGISSTDAANGARVRVFVSSSASAATLLDRAVLRATYNGEQFTLYANEVVDRADGTPSVDHWGLSGT